MTSFGMPGAAEIVIIMLILGVLVLPLVLVIAMVIFVRRTNATSQPTHEPLSLDCPSCHVAIPHASAFCPHCGAALTSTDDR
ncbi:zinc ribbon domain-containing protein [Novipirellula caenicola]|uniref:Zinc-ribbon domain-containing protein n=1 Tax=Novipirellula caenicola TaxID=1536901 RepID=A0ABP9VNG4_9BACT